MASRYQHHIALEIHLQSRYVVVGSQAATFGRVGISMEACEVQNALALGPLFWVYQKLGAQKIGFEMILIAVT